MKLRMNAFRCEKDAIGEIPARGLDSADAIRATSSVVRLCDISPIVY